MIKNFYPLHLSNTELLSIVCDSEPIALKIQEMIPTLNGLNRLTIEDLIKVPGIGEYKAKKILIILEMARRMKYEQVPIKTKIKCSQDSYHALEIMTNLSGLNHEEVWCLYLNRNNQILKCIRISEGGLTETVIDIRIIMNHALMLLANAIVVAHNHPSGNLSFSEADCKITKKIKDACGFLNILLLDHLIISENGYLSMADENIL